MRFAKFLVAGVVIALALTGCSRSTGTSGSDTGTTIASSPATAAEFCAKVKNEVDAFDITGISVKSPADLKRTYQNLAPKLEQIAAVAPSAIKSDLDAFITLEQKVNNALADADYDPSQLPLSELPELTSPATLGTLRNLRDYFTQQCHFVEKPEG